MSSSIRVPVGDVTLQTDEVRRIDCSIAPLHGSQTVAWRQEPADNPAVGQVLSNALDQGIVGRIAPGDRTDDMVMCESTVWGMTMPDGSSRSARSQAAHLIMAG